MTTKNVIKMEAREEVAKRYKKEELNYRSDGRLEWVCKHGIGHTIWYPKKMGSAGGVHGCDGCCRKQPLSSPSLKAGVSRGAE